VIDQRMEDVRLCLGSWVLGNLNVIDRYRVTWTIFESGGRESDRKSRNTTTAESLQSLLYLCHHARKHVLTFVVSCPVSR
jgi:hypothetical protein